MRTYHRWLSVLFGIFILWIAVTGVMSQVAELVANGGFENEAAERRESPRAAAAYPIIPAAQAHEGEPMNGATPAAAAPAAFVCPADMNCRPKAAPSSARAWVGWLHHIHSGTEFGPTGVIISLLSGIALVFFAFSGLYMYIQMYRRRSHRHSHPKRIFWP